jgi:hypothetical protein
MGKAGVPLSREKLLRAIRKGKGRISAIALEMKCNQSTIYSYLRSDPELAMLLDDVREQRNNEIDEREHDITERAYDNLKAFVSDHNHKATMACVSTSQFFVRAEHRRRDMEKVHAPWARQISLEFDRGNDIPAEPSV